MTALVHAELIKLTTTRTFLGLVGSALILSLGFTALAGSQAGPGDEVGEAVVDFSSLFILVLGILGMAGEWRHRTIAGSLLAAPDRLRFVAAKLLAYAVAGAVLSLVVNVGALALATALVPEPLDGGDAVDRLWHSLVIAGYYGVLGVAIGALVRNQPAAIVGVLLWLLIGEPLLVALADEVGRYGPLEALPSAFADSEGVTVNGEDASDLVSSGAAFGWMMAWLAAAGTAAALTVRRRDVV